MREIHANAGLLAAENLSYSLPDGRQLFKDISVSFDQEKSGLTGPNGSGKSSLIKLLTGKLLPQSGSIYRTGIVVEMPDTRLWSQNVSLAAMLGVNDRLEALDRADSGEASEQDIALLANHWDLRERIQSVLDRIGLRQMDLSGSTAGVSGGEATRIALAGIELQRADLIILDEPSNHLDAQGRAYLKEFLREFKGGVLCVSHDRELLRSMDRIVSLSESGKLRIYGGNYDLYRTVREQEQLAASRELESARADLRKSRRNAVELRERQERRSVRAKRGRVEANIPKIQLNTMKARAENAGGKFDAVVKRELEERNERVRAARVKVEESSSVRFDIPSSGLADGRNIVMLKDVCFSYQIDSKVFDLKDINFEIRGPERIAITGRNGSGKSTLLKLIMRELDPYSGSVFGVPLEEIGYMDQKGSMLRDDFSVFENHRHIHPDMDINACRYSLARFHFSHLSALQITGTLSAGQRLRAQLACVLGGQKPPSLLVLDEPTNHLDLETVEALEAALSSYDGAVLVVCHDRDFLKNIGITRIEELHRGRIRRI